MYMCLSDQHLSSWGGCSQKYGYRFDARLYVLGQSFNSVGIRPLVVLKVVLQIVLSLSWVTLKYLILNSKVILHFQLHWITKSNNLPCTQGSYKTLQLLYVISVYNAANLSHDYEEVLYSYLP